MPFKNPIEYKKYQKKYYLENRLNLLETMAINYDKNRDKIIEKNKKWTKENWIKVRKRMFLYYKNKYSNKKIKAKNRIAVLLKSGKIIKPIMCSKCGSNKRIQGHHYDYNKPEEVIWVCQSCHGFIHRKVR